MKNKIFGTDGIRALETAEIFTKKNLRSLSKSIIKNKKKFKIVIGRDPRRSSSKIEKKLSDELKKSGGIVFLAGLTPTPTISYLTKKFHCKLGIVISASHNPYNFNGLKFFNAKGEKLSDKEEKQIEKDYFNFKRNDFKNKRDGMIKKINNPLKIYRSQFYKNYKIQTKGKIKIVIDCANGSTFKVAKQVLPKNIEFIFINDKPNGLNINYKCGSTYINNLKKHVKKRAANFGISFDGDGDRILCCDEKGQVIDGDKILAFLVKYSFFKKKQMPVVGTLMSNMGLEKFFSKLGLKFYRADVGDKYVYELMKKKGSIIGGEQSGHIILRKYAPSGDGLFVAMKIIKIISQINSKPSKIFNLYKPSYQIKKNIKLKDSEVYKNKKVIKLINLYNSKKYKDSRCLIRFSGTEPILRILVEGYSYSIINTLFKNISKKISTAI